MTPTIAPTTVGAPDIADPAADTLAGSWTPPHRREATPLPQFPPPGWTIPPSPPPEVPSVEVQLRQIRDWTGWSFRMLGMLTGTTHPTIEAVLEGRTRLTRTPDTARRISALHRLISRLRVVVHGDPKMLVRVLSEPPGDGRPTAVELFSAGDLAAAYLAALDVFRPPRTDGMMRSVFPTTPGNATSAVQTSDVANLYAMGWRQGSFVEAELPMAGLVIDDHGQVRACSGTHCAWVVASQDCDLNDWETTRTEPLVELRARITADDPDTEWGIRSRVVRLTESEGVHSDSAPLRISPAALVAVARPADVITPARATAFKTWLGRRYDRPDVPDDQVALAKDIAARARRPSRLGSP